MADYGRIYLYVGFWIYEEQLVKPTPTRTTHQIKKLKIDLCLGNPIGRYRILNSESQLYFRLQKLSRTRAISRAREYEKELVNGVPPSLSNVD